MDRETARYAVLALLGIVAVSLSAATLSNPTERAPRDGGFVAPPAYDSPAATIDAPVLTVLALVLVAAALVYLFRYRRTLFRRVALVVAVAGVAFLFLYLYTPSDVVDAPDSGGAVNESDGFPSVDEPTANETGGSIAAEPEFQFAVVWIVLGILCVGAVVAASRWASPDEDDEMGGETSSEGMAAVGHAAGRAADRLEGDVDVDNEVYRTWTEMTGLLDPASPETRTPGEFERAAIAAGMDREDVRELTRLFERVRYGAHEPIEDDERRAIEIFRRIERAYAEDER